MTKSLKLSRSFLRITPWTRRASNIFAEKSRKRSQRRTRSFDNGTHKELAGLTRLAPTCPDVRAKSSHFSRQFLDMRSLKKSAINESWWPRRVHSMMRARALPHVVTLATLTPITSGHAHLDKLTSWPGQAYLDLPGQQLDKAGVPLDTVETGVVQCGWSMMCWLTVYRPFKGRLVDWAMHLLNWHYQILNLVFRHFPMFGNSNLVFKGIIHSVLIEETEKPHVWSTWDFCFGKFVSADNVWLLAITNTFFAKIPNIVFANEYQFCNTKDCWMNDDDGKTLWWVSIDFR